MAIGVSPSIRDDLLDRRRRLRTVVDRVGAAPDVERLLDQVDSALSLVEQDIPGKCVFCDEVMVEEIARHPMGQYCLCDLSQPQVRALESDLQTAWSIQAGLLPAQDLEAGGWRAHYRYVPAGPVSGDIIDVVGCGERSLYFLLGDVAGKGVSAALLMAHLSAMFRSLAEARLPVTEILARVSDALTERTDAARYVTLVVGLTRPDGRLEIANAGHVPPLLARDGGVEPLAATGVPAGLFRDSRYGLHRRRLDRGESVVLYTDGLTESSDPAGDEYGIDGLSCDLEAWSGLQPCALASTALSAAAAFRGGSPAGDDQTLLVLRRG